MSLSGTGVGGSDLDRWICRIGTCVGVSKWDRYGYIKVEQVPWSRMWQIFERDRCGSVLQWDRWMCVCCWVCFVNVDFYSTLIIGDGHLE